MYLVPSLGEKEGDLTSLSDLQAGVTATSEVCNDLLQAREEGDAGGGVEVKSGE